MGIGTRSHAQMAQDEIPLPKALFRVTFKLIKGRVSAVAFRGS